MDREKDGEGAKSPLSGLMPMLVGKSNCSAWGRMGKGSGEGRVAGNLIGGKKASSQDPGRLAMVPLDLR